MTVIETYNDKNFRIICHKSSKKNEKYKCSKIKDEEKQSFQCEIDRVSLSRTKRNIKRLALSNNFEYFATLTINSKFANRFSLEEIKVKLKKVFKKIQRNNTRLGLSKFEYLFIFEKHKNGAFHLHGLVKGLHDLHLNEFGYYSSLEFEKVGFNSFSKIKNYSKTCNYITKYVTKDCVKDENNQVYFRSRGLSFGEREEMPIEFSFDYFEQKIGNSVDIPYFENDFVKIKDINLDDCSVEDKVFFLDYFSKNYKIQNSYYEKYNNLLTKYNL